MGEPLPEPKESTEEPTQEQTEEPTDLNANLAPEDSEEKTVSMQIFVIVVAIMALLLLVVVIYLLCTSCSAKSEKHEKRLPTTQDEDVEMTGIPRSSTDKSVGGLTLGEGVSTNTGLNAAWQNDSKLL